MEHARGYLGAFETSLGCTPYTSSSKGATGRTVFGRKVEQRLIRSPDFLPIPFIARHMCLSSVRVRHNAAIDPLLTLTRRVQNRPFSSL